MGGRKSRRFWSLVRQMAALGRCAAAAWKDRSKSCVSDWPLRAVDEYHLCLTGVLALWQNEERRLSKDAPGLVRAKSTLAGSEVEHVRALPKEV